jgi:hypothetical protein
LQMGVQKAGTNQGAIGGANSNQTAVNANVPVSIAGGDVNSGPSSATQTANSAATTNVSNNATTNQSQSQQQTVGGNDSCLAGCGGAGAAQIGGQNAETNQGAIGVATSDQTAVNANVPVSIGAGNVNSGPSSATQTANSAATANVGNTATTNQNQSQQQAVGGNSSCLAGCGGAGAAQIGGQNAETNQLAVGLAGSEQNAVNSNVPVSIAGGDVNSGPSSATQTANSAATANVGNTATTNQTQSQQQTVGGNSSCLAGCGGASAAQIGGQNAETNQLAVGLAGSEQNAVNSNAGRTTAAGNINGGPSSATQTAASTGVANVSNNGATNQAQQQSQLLSSPALPMSTGTVSRTTVTTTQHTTGVAGVKTTRVTHRSGLAGVRVSRTLPFTGVSLLGAFIFGLLLILAGIALRLSGKPDRRDPRLLGVTPAS